MKLSRRKNGKGYVTSYSLTFGSREAKQYGLVDDSGICLEIKEITKKDDNTLEIKFKNKETS